MKTAILITARLKSTRLPRKVVLPLGGEPMIHHQIDRLRLTERPEQVILCTSPVAQDDPLVEVAESKGIPCFRGDPDDVLVRLTTAAQEHDVDLVLNATADNPYVDPRWLDRLANYHLEQEHDFTRVWGLPLGSEGWALNRAAMERACELKASRDTEVWAGYFEETGEFRWGYMEVSDPSVHWPELRLTVDTPQDYELVTRIYDELHTPGEWFFLEDIVKLCREKPELPAINADIQQARPRPIKLKGSGDRGAEG